MISLNDLLVLVPELFLTAAACLVLLFDVFIKDDQRDATHWMAIRSIPFPCSRCSGSCCWSRPAA